MTRDREDFEFLAANSRECKALGLAGFEHLDQAIGVRNYIRIANEIAHRMGTSLPDPEDAPRPSVRLLDWGCGFGQMTYLLARRGLDVVPFDVRPVESPLPDVPLTRAIPPVTQSRDPVTLPFADASFDAVLSCGVLEHVDEFTVPGNELRSLREILRILRPGGALLIYQLPQRLAWQEALMRKLKLGYAHPRRYSAREIRAELSATGYRVVSLRRMNLLPKNLTGLPAALRRLYSRFSGPAIALDRGLSRVPGLNRFAGVLEIEARRAG